MTFLCLETSLPMQRSHDTLASSISAENWCLEITLPLLFPCIASFIRWFKFTLKPPYSGAHERSLFAIWDTSHWNFFVKFGLRTAWDISYDILLSLLKFVNFWQLQGRLSILAKIGCLQKIKVFLMKERRGFNATWGVLGSQITRLYDGTIFGGVRCT